MPSWVSTNERFLFIEPSIKIEKVNLGKLFWVNETSKTSRYINGLDLDPHSFSIEQIQDLDPDPFFETDQGSGSFLYKTGSGSSSRSFLYRTVPVSETRYFLYRRDPGSRSFLYGTDPGSGFFRYRTDLGFGSFLYRTDLGSGSFLYRTDLGSGSAIKWNEPDSTLVKEALAWSPIVSRFEFSTDTFPCSPTLL